MTKHDLGDLLNTLSRPRAPAELKHRVLSAARQANAEVERQSLEERLWSSTGLRYAWVGAVFFLVAVNVFLGYSPAPGAVADGLAVSSNWMGSPDLESALADHRSGGPTVAEVRTSYDEYLFDSMVQGDRS
jgi:hypothetical protein